jgi:hypothetical protein
MDYLGYLIAGWGVVLCAVAIYAFSLLRRGKALAARVPADRRRWMTSND